MLLRGRKCHPTPFFTLISFLSFPLSQQITALHILIDSFPIVFPIPNDSLRLKELQLAIRWLFCRSGKLGQPHRHFPSLFILLDSAIP